MKSENRFFIIELSSLKAKLFVFEKSAFPFVDINDILFLEKEFDKNDYIFSPFSLPNEKKIKSVISSLILEAEKRLDLIIKKVFLSFPIVYFFRDKGILLKKEIAKEQFDRMGIDVEVLKPNEVAIASSILDANKSVNNFFLINMEYDSTSFIEVKNSAFLFSTCVPFGERDIQYDIAVSETDIESSASVRFAEIILFLKKNYDKYLHLSYNDKPLYFLYSGFNKLPFTSILQKIFTSNVEFYYSKHITQNRRNLTLVKYCGLLSQAYGILNGKDVELGKNFLSENLDYKHYASTVYYSIPSEKRYKFLNGIKLSK